MSHAPFQLRSTCFIVAAAFGFVVVEARVATAAPQNPAELRDLSLEQLGELVVVSVTKQSEELWRTAASVSVLTSEDIRRSGATSLPEVLRQAPGVDVARVDASHYAIGTRGFAEPFSKSLLVLVDGRNLYNQLFAGTYWPAHDIPLDDIERVEIIRGPGGTIWGGNAVTGVINVITKRAAATKGVLAAVGTGSTDPGSVTLRYGGEHGALDYRVYTRAALRGSQFHPDGIDFDDSWVTQAGFRVDRERRGGGSLTLQGDISVGGHGQRVRLASFSPPGSAIVDDPVDTAGGNVLASWDQRLGATDLRLKSYYARTSWDAPQFAEVRDTIDVDLLQSALVTPRNRLSWGAGLRWSHGRFRQTVPTLDFSPATHTDWLTSLFLRNEFQLVPDRLSLIAGSKFERNVYTGFEVQPTARILWRPAPTQSVWAAVSRAVRTPSRIERAISAATFVTTTPLPVYLRVLGSDSFDAEHVLSSTAGYRALVSPQFLIDTSVFFNDHDDLTGFERLPNVIETTPGPTRVLVPVRHLNGVYGTSRGLEVAPEWRPLARWRLSGSYAYRRISLRSRPENVDPNAVLRYEGSTPRHLVQVQSRLDLSRRIELDASYRVVSELPFQLVDRYHSADVRVGWRAADRLEVAVTGHNLLEPHHFEFRHEPGPSVGIARSVSVRLTWKRPGP